MRPAVLLALILLAASPGTRVAAEPPHVQIGSSWEWAGPLQVRAGLSSAEMSVVLFAEAPPQKPPRAPRLVFGLTTPWILAGPVDRRGLAQILENPIGFSPTSSVYQEPVGMVLNALDASSASPSLETGLVLMPVPRLLGLYSLRQGDGVQQIGVFAGQLPRDGPGAEMVLCLSRPEPEEGEGSWLSHVQLYPGGNLLVAAARAGFRSSSASIQTVTGVSLCERSPPGAMVQVNGGLKGDLGDLRALLACTNETFYSSLGKQVPRGERLALTLEERGVDRAVRGSLSVDQGRIEFAPARFLSQTVRASMVLDRTLARWTRGSLFARLSAEKQVEWSSTGERSEEGRCAVLARCRSGKLTFTADASLEETAELSLQGSAELDLSRAGDRLRLETRALLPPVGDPSLSISASGRRRWQDSVFQVECGVTDLTLPGSLQGLQDSLVLKLSWRTGLARQAR